MIQELTPEMIGQRARAAVEKVDAQGHRGLTLLSLQEIEALVLVAALAGQVLRQIPVTNPTKPTQEQS